MSALHVFTAAGIQVSIEESGGLRLKGLSKLPVEQKRQILNFAKTHKSAIIAALTHAGKPGQCESCPAAGYWDYAQYAGQGPLCFHYAYFLGKPGKPKPCSEMRSKCPRKALQVHPAGEDRSGCP